MTEPQGETSRRGFFKDTGRVAAASASRGRRRSRHCMPPVMKPSRSFALIGLRRPRHRRRRQCTGGQGGLIKLVAMADVFDDRLKSSHENLKKDFKDLVDVPMEQQFIGGFDGNTSAPPWSAWARGT